MVKRASRILMPALAGLALAIASTLSWSPACAQENKNLTGDISIDGSSTVQPISAAVAEDFKDNVNDKVRVTVATSGTGGGFKRFVKGELDIADASRPIKKDELDQAKGKGVEFIELPIAYDGLSIVVNKANYWCESLTIPQLQQIFGSGRAAKTWKEVNSEWPDQPIKLYSPGTDSGTFEYFKEVVVGKEGKIRSDMQVSEDDNILVRGVSGDENALGFFGYAYFDQNREQLKIVKIDGGKGAIEPTPQTIENGTYAPFSRPLFIYVNKKSAARPEVKAFVEFYLTNAAKLAEEVGYVKLPDTVYQAAKANFKSFKTGTQFQDAEGKAKTGPITTIYK